MAITIALSGTTTDPGHQEQQREHRDQGDEDGPRQAGAERGEHVHEDGGVAGDPGLDAGRAVRPYPVDKSLSALVLCATTYREHDGGQVRARPASQFYPDDLRIGSPASGPGVQVRRSGAGDHANGGLAGATVPAGQIVGDRDRLDAARHALEQGQLDGRAKQRSPGGEKRRGGTERDENRPSLGEPC
jgi:hypothetical protein